MLTAATGQSTLMLLLTLSASHSPRLTMSGSGSTSNCHPTGAALSKRALGQASTVLRHLFLRTTDAHRPRRRRTRRRGLAERHRQSASVASALARRHDLDQSEFSRISVRQPVDLGVVNRAECMTVCVPIPPSLAHVLGATGFREPTILACHCGQVIDPAGNAVDALGTMTCNHPLAPLEEAAADRRIPRTRFIWLKREQRVP